MLDQQDPDRPGSPPGRHDALLAEYSGYLRQACGLSEYTRLYRLRYAREFQGRNFGDDTPAPDRLKPADIPDYFRSHAGSSPTSRDGWAGLSRHSAWPISMPRPSWPPRTISRPSVETEPGRETPGWPPCARSCS